MTNPIADPLVEVPDTETESELVTLTATVDGVATVTINRAAKRNAFNAEVISALSQVFESLQAADGVRLVLLTGAGQGFSAGADLEWMKAAVEWSEADNREDAMALAVMLNRLYDLPAMTVALVNGAAMGGGAGLVAACDYAVAVESAQFAFSEVKLGLTPATISPYVVAAIGPRRARALFATGKVFDAAFAEKIGLVDEVVADAAGLQAVADRIAGEIRLAAPGAVADAKLLVDHVAHKKIDHGLMEETARRIAKRRVSPEGQEGVRAFLDRKKPGWAE
ncbi:methylglutaconyl-CoA hydratase [Caulobacter ginsengisoli]|uniref:Methylglutaconyl-CoA hydratase n=1 Tax=Caulobacter ginsengisoli TaxID=400775 RepID=A0ABU0ILC2_9CAUL|nr:enoyl-CoA hydratase-related protein [Caulobacter ginsengisoli]MDQ0462819.1 methylglutaconyl-CoA hydratase [Caulobacter ginsengisoli]